MFVINIIKLLFFFAVSLIIFKIKLTALSQDTKKKLKLTAAIVFGPLKLGAKIKLIII